MPRGKPTSEFQRDQIIALHQLKLPSRAISKQLKIPKSTINEIIKKYKKNKSVTDEAQPGRPKLSSKREDRSLVLKSIKDRKLTAPILKNIWKEEDNVIASSSTVKRRLIDAGLNGRISRRKPPLLPRHKQQHLQWAKDHRDWTEDMGRKLYGLTSPIFISSIVRVELTYNVDYQKNLLRTVYRAQ